MQPLLTGQDTVGRHGVGHRDHRLESPFTSDPLTQPYKSPLRHSLMVPLYRWEIWGSEMLTESPKLTKQDQQRILVLWRPTRPSRTNTQKRCPFHYRRLECKSRKSWNTWSNRQIWPWSTEWRKAKANRILSRERTGHSKHSLPTTQEKTQHMDITRWSIPKSDWLYSLQPKMEKLYTVSKNKTGSWLWLRSWTPYCQIQTEIEESRENH